MASQVIIVVVIALKFLVPVLYLAFPFAAGWANLLLDSIDGDILVPAGLAFDDYQTVDKVADYWAYICMLLWGWRTAIRREIAATFAGAGQPDGFHRAAADVYRRMAGA